MQSEMVKVICQVGIFIVCAQVMVHFRPDGSYEKYLKMLVSAMILVQMLRPVGGLWGGRERENLESRVARFEAQLNESMGKAVLRNAQGEALLEQMTLEEVRKRMGEGEEKEGNVSVEIEPVEQIEIRLREKGEDDAGVTGAAGEPETGLEKSGLEEMVSQG